MAPLFKTSGDDLPLTYDLDYDAFLKYRGDWLLYRNLGHFDASGGWVPPISFDDALKYPKDMMDLFFKLDDIVAKKMSQLSKKKAGQAGRTGTRRRA